MKFCPDCGSDLTAHLAVGGQPVQRTEAAVELSTAKYDQTSVWTDLTNKAALNQATPPQPSALGMKIGREVAAVVGANPKKPVQTIVHLVFDRPIVPSGGALAAVVVGNAKDLDLGRMKAMGYAIEDGKVMTSGEMPLGQAYKIIDYWGGEKQFRRWHLDSPVLLEASRNGDPFFMDENMIAFGATWNDPDKAEEAFMGLMDLFTEGVNGEGIIAHPLEARISVRNQA